MPLLLALLAPSLAQAAEPLAHARWGLDEGLPVASVNDLAFDARGYLWAATFDGLVRFDGARFVVFSVETTPGLPSNRLVFVEGAADGALVFATESGVVGRFDPVVGTWNHATVGAANNVVTVGPAGEVWTAGPRGVARLVGDALVPFGPPLDALVRSIAVDGGGDPWVGTDRGLARVRADAVRWWTRADGLPTDSVVSVSVDAEGGAWLATATGPARVVGDRVEPLRVGGQPWTEPALFARPDGRGGALVGTQRGVWRWSDGEAARLDPLDQQRAPLRDVTADGWTITRHALLRDGVVVHRVSDPDTLGFNDLEPDGEGGVFLATGSDGLHRFAPAPIRAVGVAQGMSHPNAYALEASADGGVWVGTQRGGLNRVVGDRADVVFGADGPDRNVSAVLEASDGTLWIGTHDAGIFRRAPGADPSVHGGFAADGLGPTQVRALEELDDGALIAGTKAGLWRRDGGVWSAWALPGLPTTVVRAVLQTPDGAVWLGTNGEGVARLEGDRVTRFGRAEGYPSDSVRSLWAAPDGTVWVGTEDRGLFAIVDPARPSSSRPLSRSEGLPDHCVHALVPDGEGALWGSTNRGLFRASVADLGAYARGEADRVAIERFDERDGMADREANGGVHQSGVRAADGTLWFATQAGVVHLDPAAFREGAPAPVVLEDVEVDGRSLPLAPGSLVVTPDRRTFGLTYAALAFHAPERQRFWTRMDGMPGGWTYHGDRRTAWFTELQPGEYTFRVRATPPGEPGPEAAIAVSVPPTWTETSLFRALLFLGALGLVGLAGWARILAGQRRERILEALVAARTRDLATQTAAAESARATIAEQAAQLREVDRLKTRFFEDLSHELRTPLTLVLGPLEDARSGRLGAIAGPAADALGRAERSARRLRALVDQLLDLVRIDVGALKLTLEIRDLAGLLRRLADEFGPAADRRGIALQVSLPAGVVPVSCDARELEKVFTNLLGNALKFTPTGGTVRLALAVAEGTARVEVADTGPGIAPADQARIFDRFTLSTSSTMQAGTGIGLSLARELTERHGGALSLASSLGAGSTFTVALPLASGPIVPVQDAPRAPVEADPDPSPSPADDRDRITVLVVDDEPELRGWIRSILAARYRVVEATNGAEGLQRAREELPDLVVSDVMMPELDGFGLVRAVRADRRLDWLPIVLLTARGSEASHVEGVTRGADVYLTKPFSSSVLLAHAAQLLAQRERLRERFAAAPAAPTEEVLSADERYLRKVRAAIEAGMGDPEFSVEALADAVAQDRTHLFRQLKELTGEPPSVLIRTARLERAAKLLSARAGNVSEIGYACGFSSVSQFSRAFRAHFGVPPSEWEEAGR